jgi:hypothetical protein
MEFAISRLQRGETPPRLMTPTNPIVAVAVLIISDVHANWPALRAVVEPEPNAATPFSEEVIASLAHVLRTGGALPQKTMDKTLA